MPLPDSGTLRLSDIVDEFGGSGNHGLSEYVRGGAFVGDTPVNSGVPTAPPIAISDFYGASAGAAATYNVPAGTYTDLSGDSTFAAVTVTFAANGTYQISTFTEGIIFSGSWAIPNEAADGSQYLRVDVSFGSFTSSSGTGTDIQLNANRSYSVLVNGLGTHACVATFTIKDGPGGNTLDSGVINMLAETF